MITTLTWSKLKEFSLCPEAVEWGREKYNGQESQDSVQVITDLIADKKLYWANWLIVRLMTRPQHLAYAIYSAEQVIDIFEKKYPDDDRPRKAIEITKKILKDTEENRKIAYTAVQAASEAANTAASVASEIDVASAAYTAAYTAASASAADYATSAAAYVIDAVDAAGNAAGNTAEKEKMQIKILNYGIELMKKYEPTSDSLKSS